VAPLLLLALVGLATLACTDAKSEDERLAEWAEQVCGELRNVGAGFTPLGASTGDSTSDSERLLQRSKGFQEALDRIRELIRALERLEVPLAARSSHEALLSFHRGVVEAIEEHLPRWEVARTLAEAERIDESLFERLRELDLQLTFDLSDASDATINAILLQGSCDSLSTVESGR
jgi:exonuclease VII small subunit